MSNRSLRKLTQLRQNYQNHQESLSTTNDQHSTSLNLDLQSTTEYYLDDQALQNQKNALIKSIASSLSFVSNSSSDDDLSDQDAHQDTSKTTSSNTSTNRQSKSSKNKLSKTKKKKSTKHDKDLQFLDQEWNKLNKQHHKMNPLASSKDRISRNLFIKTLLIEPENLNPDNEFKQLFGADVLHTVQREESSQGGSNGIASAGYSNRMRKMIRKNVMRRKKTGTSSSNFTSTLQRDVFASAKDHWPPYFNPGIRLRLVSVGKDGTQHFQFGFNDSYAKLERQFEMCIESHDPNSFVQLLQHGNPYHVSTLLQMSEIYRMQGDFDIASDYVERALYVIQQTFTVQLYKALQDGDARLYFDKNDSAQVYVQMMVVRVFLSRLHLLNRSGCYSTCLELSKMLFQLHPIFDPSNALVLHLDHFALRSTSYGFLLKFGDALKKIQQKSKQSTSLDSDENDKKIKDVEKEENNISENLGYLPNMMYSLAFARFKQEKQLETEGNSSSSSNNKNEPSVSSDELLQEALILWPMLLSGLIDICKWQIGKWDSTIRGTMFLDLFCTSKAFSNLIYITVEVNHLLYKDDEDGVEEWIFKNVKYILENQSSSVLKLKMKQAQERRDKMYKDKTILNMYGLVNSGEVNGTILPDYPCRSMETRNEANSESTGSPVPSFLNPVLDYFTSLIPMLRNDEDEFDF